MGYGGNQKSCYKLPLEANTDDFAFDAQMLAEILWAGATIGEVSCPTVYFKDASSISFARSCTYGVGCLKTALLYRLCKLGVMRSKKFGGVVFERALVKTDT